MSYGKGTLTPLYASSLLNDIPNEKAGEYLKKWVALQKDKTFLYRASHAVRMISRWWNQDQSKLHGKYFPPKPSKFKRGSQASVADCLAEYMQEVEG